MDNRLAKANSAFDRLYKRVWNNNNLKKDTKISVHKAVVLTTLLYGAKTWVIYRRHLRLIERYHQRCLRTILNIHWSDFVTNIEGLEMAKFTSTEAMLLKIQLRWAGHVSRLEEHRLPNNILYGELSTGHRDKLRGTSDKIQRHFEKVPRHMQHRLPPVSNTSSQSNELATHSLPGYHFL